MSTTVDEQPTSESTTTLTFSAMVRDAESLRPQSKDRTPTPLPIAQLTILCLSRLAEPIAYTQIFPYINQMMQDLKVTDDPSKIGFYSGLVDSIFAIAQLTSIYQWGKLSSRIGRKPVILLGMCGVVLSSLCFGMSYNLWTAVVARCLAGILSGNSAVVSSMISEITDETNQAKAFPLPAISWSLGCIIGPMIGGSLSHPVERYPEIFGGYTFLQAHPYFLPCAVSSSITIISIFMTSLFVEETLPRIVAERKAAKSILFGESQTLKSDRAQTYGAITPSPSSDRLASKDIEPPTHIPSAWEILSVPQIQVVFLSGALLSFLTVGWEVVFILFSYTPIDLGGMGQSPAEIGYVLAGGGIVYIILSVGLFPWLQSRISSRVLYMLLMALWPLLYVAIPILSTEARLNIGSVPLWISIGFVIFLMRLACLNFSLSMILTKRASPTPEALGSTFGLQQSSSCIARALGPAFTSSLYAVSIEKNLLGGNLVWFVMVALSFAGVYVASRLDDEYDADKRFEEDQCYDAAV